MNNQTRVTPLIMLLLASFPLVACGSDEAMDEDVISISDAESQAAAEDAGQQADTFPGDLQPLDPEGCDELAAALEGAFHLPVSRSNIAVEHEGKSGGGCQATTQGTGLDFTDMFSIEGAMRTELAFLGWADDPAADFCLGVGGWGPGANLTCFTQDAGRCALFVYMDPVDEALCSNDEPIGVCFENLTPEQIVYTVELTCTWDESEYESCISCFDEEQLMDLEPIEICFKLDDDSVSVSGEVSAGGSEYYTFIALKDQEMQVNLFDPDGAPIAADTAVLAIWGADGTVLISSGAEAVSWEGQLSSTQEYLIEVLSIAAEPVAYTMEVTIPPLMIPMKTGVFPGVEPFPFGEMQMIVLSGVPPMLPGEFLVEAGQPKIAAYILNSDNGIYEISLDYGADCQGAGACHYGSAAGMKVDFDVPIGTSSFPFDFAEAQEIELLYGITGYFIEGACGVNCNDSRVWWVFEGYQYMIGLKGAEFNHVVLLANNAIRNSIP